MSEKKVCDHCGGFEDTHPWGKYYETGCIEHLRAQLDLARMAMWRRFSPSSNTHDSECIARASYDVCENVEHYPEGWPT